MALNDYSGDDDDKELQNFGSNRRFKDFDCPDCNANNPHDESFGDGDEVRCYYCGAEFTVSVNDDGKAKFREA